MAQCDPKTESNPITNSALAQQIQEYPVLVYSDSSSRECRELKELLQEYGIKFEYFEVDRMSKNQVDDPVLFHTNVAETSGLSTLPVLYVGGEVVGGLTSLREELQDGRFHKRLRSLDVFGRNSKRLSLS